MTSANIQHQELVISGVTKKDSIYLKMTNIQGMKTHMQHQQLGVLDAQNKAPPELGVLAAHNKALELGVLQVPTKAPVLGVLEVQTSAQELGVLDALNKAAELGVLDVLNKTQEESRILIM